MSSQYQPLGHNPPGRRRSLLVQLTRSKVVIGIALLLFLTTLASHQGRTAAQTGIEKVKKYGQRIGGSMKGEDDGVFVQLRKEELLELVGRNPRYLTMDGWATYGFK